MSVLRLLFRLLTGPWICLLVVGLLHTAPVLAQGAPQVPAPATDERNFRDVSRYSFPPVAGTVFDLQMLAYAMQLREFCANQRVPDDFVRQRLARFSEMSGRDEDCDSLADY